MKKLVKPLLWGSICLSAINFIWLVFSSAMYLDMAGTLKRPTIYMMIIYYGLLFLLINSLVILFTIIHSLKRSKRFFAAGVILLILGALSFAGIIVHFACLIDINNDFAGGFGIGQELQIVQTLQVLHLIFLAFSVIYFWLILKSPDNSVPSKTLFREQIFVSMNITGIVCSIAGVLIAFLYFSYLNMDINKNHLLRRYDIVPFLFILLPYFFITTGWIIRYFKDRLKGLIDEKLTSDINRSGMFTMLVSLPLLLIVMIKTFLGSPVVYKGIYISGTITILWVALYLFIVIFIFSASALYNFRNK